MPRGKIGIDTGHMHPLGGVFGSPESSAGLLAEFHEQFGKFPLVSGLLLQGVGMTETFPLKINRINLPSPQAQIPVIAQNTLKDLVFEELEGGMVKLYGDEDAVGVEPRLKAGVDAVQIQKFHLAIDIQYVGVIDDIEAVRQLL